LIYATNQLQREKKKRRKKRKKKPLCKRTYPAAAARISCLLALVKRLSTQLNNSVQTIITARQSALTFADPAGCLTVSQYKIQIGTTSSARIRIVISIVTTKLMRERVK
jgi:hypothetical protein